LIQLISGIEILIKHFFSSLEIESFEVEIFQSISWDVAEFQVLILIVYYSRVANLA
jgi:hypothetical protein